ncbi:hypothetical protein NPIL_583511 [Nephila pilipes]|uniref:Uncharacterized protein n=1 Tax=Nephila pilipes TaxID=299642 RepID=A0A8X6UDX8_NEPPI|nr:hypothetical protein NPIL_583511 [Nephila pilipes]
MRSLNHERKQANIYKKAPFSIPNSHAERANSNQLPESVIIKQKLNRHRECGPPRALQNCGTLHPTAEPRQTRGQDNQTERFHGQKKVIREEERMRWRLRGVPQRRQTIREGVKGRRPPTEKKA